MEFSGCRVPAPLLPQFFAVILMIVIAIVFKITTMIELEFILMGIILYIFAVGIILTIEIKMIKKYNFVYHYDYHYNDK